VASTNCELITINRKDYIDIVKKFDKKRKLKSEFMERIVPHLDTVDSQAAWEILFSALKESVYHRGNYVTTEGEKGNKMFFIYKGECEIETSVSATHKNEKSDSGKKVLATLQEGSCFGEEILYSENPKYKYNIKVRHFIYLENGI